MLRTLIARIREAFLSTTQHMNPHEIRGQFEDSKVEVVS